MTGITLKVLNDLRWRWYRLINRNIFPPGKKRPASASERLDLSAAQIAHVFHLAGFSGKLPIRDKSCLELGSGWVLSHAMVFYLLGAKRVIATDIGRNVHVSFLYESIQSSLISLIRDILSPFESHDMLRFRLNKLLTIKTFNEGVLKDLGIEYIAPINLSLQPLNEKVDFVFSNSVLEHVPQSELLPLMKNVSAVLATNGKVIHCVHLEDHKDIVNAPFVFLGEPEENFTRDVQNSRGNRVRRNQWRDILLQVDNMDFQFIYEWRRGDKNLPAVIDPSVNYETEEDLFISHIGILGTKKVSVLKVD
jgi:SAM-dependent methyltransferase